MKKLVCMLTAALVAIMCIPYQYSYAESGGFVYTGEKFDIDGFLETFTTEYKDRSATSQDKERAAALFLAQKFFDLGYNTVQNSQAADKEDYLQYFTSGTIKSNNVVAVKPASVQTEKNVIIGAHYDNVYDYPQTNPYTQNNFSTLSHGAYDNGSGVAVMLAAAYELQQENLPFNVTFVAFGAEESGMHGSKHFVETMSYSGKENTLLMINLDCIAAGDFLYLFCQDWHTEHDGYIREKARGLDIPLRTLPFDKKYTADPFGRNLYSHYGHYSDNYYFLENNIPTAFFMSMNWESFKKAGVVESDTRSDIMHTSDDTYADLKELYPDTYLLHMQYVSQLVTHMLLQEDFAAAMEDSKLNSPDYRFIMDQRYLTVAAFIVWLGFAVFAYIYGGRLKKTAKESIKEFVENPENAEKINNILKNFPPMPPFNNIQYPPNAYRPKKGEKNFSVFGEEYEKKADEYTDGDNDKNDGGQQDK